MGYIEEFNIDVSTLFDLECVENELFDKVVYQQSIDLVDSFERIGELEDYNPILINPLLHQLDELENKMFDDISQLMTNAMGVAQGARDEAETAMKSWVDRWLADRNLVTREEFEAVRDMAIKARTENAELRSRIEALEGKKAAKKA